MKKIWLFIIGILFTILPFQVDASNASISVSASDTVMVGNTVTVTVKLSSSSKIGSWQADLSYDKAYLQLTSSSAEAGGTSMANVVANGTSSKSYTFKFKALKNGNTKVSVNSYALFDYDTMEKMNTTSGSKSISIKTKEEIEASYSSNTNLKSITVGEYSLNPSFDKDTLEYEVEVPNEIEKVNVSASKEDGNSTIKGTGEVTLTEGNNKVNIVVTAQKGNSKTYVVNIYRKELDPIKVTIDGDEYTIVRRSDALPEYLTFTLTNIQYKDAEIPALYSEITDYTLVGLKDVNSEIKMYIYENDEFRRYEEVKSNLITIFPQELPSDDDFKEYKKVMIDLNGMEVQGYAISEKSNFVVVYGQNIETGEVLYYTYDKKNNTFQEYSHELANSFNEKIKIYKYVILGFIALTIILVFSLIFGKKGSKGKRPKKETENVAQIVDEIEEKEPKKKKSNKDN